MSDEIERCSCNAGLGAWEHERDCITGAHMTADPRFPDSEKCNECGERFPMTGLVGDNENGGWLCPACIWIPDSHWPLTLEPS